VLISLKVTQNAPFSVKCPRTASRHQYVSPLIEIKFEFSAALYFMKASLRGNVQQAICFADTAARSTDRMTKPISDRAEVALEYPDKFYSGTFERSSRFDASMDSTGVLLVLERQGSEDVRKSVHIHINYGLLADIIEQLSSQASKIPPDEVHRDQLKRSVSLLDRALQAAPKR